MTAFAAYFGYFGASVALLALGVAAYIMVTPYRELTLIRQGNAAAASSLGGATIGLALPIASAAAHSISMSDMALWAALASVTQMVVYMAVATLLPGFKHAVAEDKVGHGIFLGAVSLAVGVLNAGALTY